MQTRETTPDSKTHADRCAAQTRSCFRVRPLPGALQKDRSRPLRRRTARLRLKVWLVPLVVLGTFSMMFVGWDVMGHRLFPALSTGWRHFLLTSWAACVTAVTTLIIYLTMRRHQRRLTETASDLSRLLESYDRGASAKRRFVNPHLIHCRDIMHCKNISCPMYDNYNERCWQVVGLDSSPDDPDRVPVTLQQCHECPVYRLSCPDALTQLGESFNNLMFLLEEEQAHSRHMRAQLVEKQKMFAIGQLSSGIAHEIGNPLSSISSIVQMLRRKGGGTDPVEALDLIDTHIRRISAIVRQLGNLSRPGDMHWERTELDDVLRESLRLISFDRRARDVDIEVQLADDPLVTYALRGQLQQVFINLALNALDAMPDGGTLVVRATCRQRHILIEMQDSGTGIDPQLGRRIFDPFFTTKQPGRGTGLGLAVSYSIIQKHGGTIDYASCPSAGTTFKIMIPRLIRPPDQRAQRDANVVLRSMAG